MLNRSSHYQAVVRLLQPKGMLGCLSGHQQVSLPFFPENDREGHKVKSKDLYCSLSGINRVEKVRRMLETHHFIMSTYLSSGKKSFVRRWHFTEVVTDWS